MPDREDRLRRSKEVVVVAHCLLNANTRVEPLAAWSGVHPVMEAIGRSGLGIVQLPCPELASEGLDRPQRDREEYDTAEYRTACERTARAVAAQIRAHRAAGHHVRAVVGVAGSPSCSTDPGRPGLLVEALRERPEFADVAFEEVPSHEPWVSDSLARILSGGSRT
jgi:hypothetical protein